MKAILEFNLPEDQAEFEQAAKAGEAYAALHDIAQEIFRPARKHGYASGTVQTLLEDANTVTNVEGWGVGTELVHELEKLFYKILEERNISLR